MSRPNSHRAGNPSPRPVNAGDVQGNQPRNIRPSDFGRLLLIYVADIVRTRTTVINYTLAPKNSTCLELPNTQTYMKDSIEQLKAAVALLIRAEVAPPHVLKTQSTHVDQAARAV